MPDTSQSDLLALRRQLEHEIDRLRRDLTAALAEAVAAKRDRESLRAEVRALWDALKGRRSALDD